MEAEIARIEDESDKALRLYEEAVTSAREAGFPLNAAISSELAGRFEFERGRENQALTWLRSAREGYAKWGAHAKVEAMEKDFNQFQFE